MKLLYACFEENVYKNIFGSSAELVGDYWAKLLVRLCIFHESI
jgi:hypothetical protein